MVVKRTFADVLVRLLLYVVMAGFGLVVLTPLFYAISTALKAEHEVLLLPVQWIPDRLHLENFVLPFQSTSHNFFRYFFNSIVVATSVTLLNLLTCSLAGYSFAKCRYFGRDFLFGFVLATLMVPISAAVIPLFLAVKFLGLMDTYGALIIPGGTSAIGVFLMRQHMLSIPDDLIAAARIDGCSEPGIFWRIVLPLVQPALSSLGIFIFMWNWDSFLWPLVAVTKGSLRTLPIGIAAFESSYSTNYPQLMAVSVLAMLPVIGLFLAMQRNFMEAMTMSGLKE